MGEYTKEKPRLKSGLSEEAILSDSEGSSCFERLLVALPSQSGGMLEFSPGSDHDPQALHEFAEFSVAGGMEAPTIKQVEPFRRAGGYPAKMTGFTLARFGGSDIRRERLPVSVVEHEEHRPWRFNNPDFSDLPDCCSLHFSPFPRSWF